MDLEAGRELLHYRLIERIGEGGMGVVWKAVDTTLGREVALKVLPAPFVGDVERMARFEREARSLAALHHPNVASVFGLHEADGVRFITMEYVAGEDLSRRIARGPLPPTEAVAIAVGIAEALAAAHAQGIVHRDLKPANVLLDADGTPKVLDFGLAKNAAPEAASGDPGASPTVTSLGTVAGMLLGTAAYMSPEQARGKPVDRRADTWALGCILFEMLAGRALFAGDTISDTLASVLKTEPDWDALPATTPPALVRILERCLAKSVRDRWQDAGDVRYELERALDAPPEAKAEAPEGGGRRRRIVPAVGWTVVGIVLGVFGARLVSGPAVVPEARTTVSELSAAEGTSFDFGRVDLALSPDGENLAYAASPADGGPRLFVRSLRTGTLRELPETAGAREPFWSPDGRELAFHTDVGIQRIGLNDAEPRALVDARGTSGAWSEDGVVLFCSGSSGAVQSYDVGSGRRVSLDFTVAGTEGCDSVAFLPDGDHFLFESTDADAPGVYLASLGSEEVRPLIDLKTNAVYSSGHILYHDGPRLLARPFDVAALEFTGDPKVVADPVFETNFPFHGLFAAARDRPRVVYLEGTGGALQTELVWFDRGGEIVERTGITGDLYNPRLSRDGRRLLVDVSTYETEGDVWLFDLDRGSSRRLTDHPIDESHPQWSPDERTVYFFRVPDLYRLDLDGDGEPALLYGNENPKRTSHASVEGVVVFHETTDRRNDIVTLDPGSGTATTWLASPADEHSAEFSPDGRWLVYQSDESGRPEVYIDRFPQRGERFRVSREGGYAPSWSADGSEIFFVSAADELVAVPVDLDSGGPPVGDPEALFRTRFRYQMFEPHPDGDRFLVVTPVDPEIDRVVLVDDWAQE